MASITPAARREVACRAQRELHDRLVAVARREHAGCCDRAARPRDRVAGGAIDKDDGARVAGGQLNTSGLLAALTPRANSPARPAGGSRESMCWLLLERNTA